MSSKVPNYKTYASIFTLFEYNKSLSPDQKTESFFNIMEHVTTDDKSIKLSETVKTLPDDEDLRILTYKTLLEKFNQKYTKLSAAQKNLLREYIKMQEAIKSINKFCGIDDKSDVVKDEYVVQTMRYLELLKELKKSGNKNKKVI